MTFTIHLISQVNPSTSGGLELWTERFARSLAEMGMRVIVYVCAEQYAPPAVETPYELVFLAPLRDVLEKPIYTPIWTERFSQERGRLNFLLLRNELRRRIAGHERERHLLISNFAVTVGYLASLVGQDLALPHIAMVVGSDFSRGFRNAREKPTIEYVCRNATALVVKNSEQARALTSELALSGIHCIPTSIEAPARIDRRSDKKNQVTLISDCGFSFKKGTGILLDSFEALKAEGFPVRLVLYGETAPDQMDYWEKRMASLLKASPDVTFPGFVSRDVIYSAFQTADIYCSATLGEGSSSGRIAAVCAGLPIVTTRCGEMESGMDDVSHVSLANVADPNDFLALLRIMVRRILKDGVRIDRNIVEIWRERFSPSREMSDWLALIRSVGRAE